MTYNRDLQEDKERLFDTADTVRATVRIVADLMPNIRVNRPACAAAVSDPALLATDLADDLVRRGVPFRAAHHAVGLAVAQAEKLGKPLNQLAPAEWRKIHRAFGSNPQALFNLRRAMTRRNLTGAPGTREVSKQLARWKDQLA